MQFGVGKALLARMGQGHQRENGYRNSRRNHGTAAEAQRLANAIDHAHPEHDLVRELDLVARSPAPAALVFVTTYVYVTVPPVSGTLVGATVLTTWIPGSTSAYVTVWPSVSLAVLPSSSLPVAVTVLAWLPPVAFPAGTAKLRAWLK